MTCRLTEYKDIEFALVWIGARSMMLQAARRPYLSHTIAILCKVRKNGANHSAKFQTSSAALEHSYTALIRTRQDCIGPNNDQYGMTANLSKNYKFCLSRNPPKKKRVQKRFIMKA